MQWVGRYDGSSGWGLGSASHLLGDPASVYPGHWPSPLPRVEEDGEGAVGGG